MKVGKVESDGAAHPAGEQPHNRIPECIPKVPESVEEFPRIITKLGYAIKMLPLYQPARDMLFLATTLLMYPKPQIGKFQAPVLLRDYLRHVAINR